eukprot:TRINITY_DN16902_c0_g4_i1.p1 TRINITY_DN16902_c0_g4~~TRINITY_DN16902_c0_g4_i1.p1  ORF type:complete len:969 (+),score=117.98 TRINITY_DN16902_c0_g4_i1:168-3074(+)
MEANPGRREAALLPNNPGDPPPPRTGRFSLPAASQRYWNRLRAAATTTVLRFRLQAFRQQRREQLQAVGTIEDTRFHAPAFAGLASREFEIDLLQGEEFCGDVIKVKLRKTTSKCYVYLRNILTFGLYSCLVKCCFSGANIYESDARLGITNLDRVLLWTHSANGGGRTCGSICVYVCKHRFTWVLLLLSVLGITVGPTLPVMSAWLQDYFVVVLILTFFALCSLMGTIFFDSTSVICKTSVRQFMAKDLSFVRVFAADQNPLFSFGIYQVAEAQLFFGVYPSPQLLRWSLPWAVWDSGLAETGAVVDSEKSDAQGISQPPLPQEAHQSTCRRLVRFGHGLVVFLAFCAAANELATFIAAYLQCVDQMKHTKVDKWDQVGDCLSSRSSDWLFGSGGSDILTVISHWIEMLDWSTQLIIFFYAVGPLLVLMSSFLADRSAVTINFLIDKRKGTYTEDTYFQSNWETMSMFLSELFNRACTAPAVSQSCFCGNTHQEVAGDVDFGEGETLPFASWTQVKEMIRDLLDSKTNQVRVYKGALSFAHGEKVMAAYPTNVPIPLLSRLTILLSFGLEYVLFWRSMKRMSALILTDRRLIEISAQTQKRLRSMKVDMFIVDSSIKYASIAPPRPQIVTCSLPSAFVTLSTRCGNTKVHLSRLRYSVDHARNFWQAVTLLQELEPIGASTSEVATEYGSEIGGSLTIARPSLVRCQTDPEKHMFVFGPKDEEQDAGRKSGLSSCRPSLRPVPEVQASGSGDVQVVLRPVESDVEDPRILTSGLGLDPWGVALVEGEELLWGPVVFEEDMFHLWFSKKPSLRRPSTVVAITSHRLVVLHFANIGCVACRGWFNYSYIKSLSSTPLKWVLGFCLQEHLQSQTTFLAVRCGLLCCRVPVRSDMVVKVLSNAGTGKAYINSLNVKQIVMPKTTEPKLFFEEESFTELRRWLGHIPSFFSTDQADRRPIEIKTTWRGWTPV